MTDEPDVTESGSNPQDPWTARRARVLRLLRVRVPADVVEDLAHDVLLLLWMRLKDRRIDEPTADRTLRVVVRDLAIRWYRRASRRPGPLPREPCAADVERITPLSEPPRKEPRSTRLRQLLVALEVRLSASLSEQQARVYSLLLKGNWSAAALGRELGISTSKVNRLVAGIAKKIRRIRQKQGPGEQTCS